MNSLFEVLPGFARLSIKFQCTEIDVISGHELDKLVDIELIFICSCESAHDFPFILADVVAVLVYYILEFLDAYFAFFGEPQEIISEISSFFIILDECVFELV